MVKIPCCILLFGILLGVNGESTFAGSSVTSDSSGTRSVLVTGRNGAGGVISSRFGGGGGGGSGVAVGSGSSSGSGGTFSSTGNGPVGAFAGPAGAYAGAGGAYASAGGAYAGAGPFGGFPYWNGGGGGAYAGGSPGYNYPYDPYNGYGGGYNNGYGNGNGVGVYSSSDSNGIQTRFANVGPGGRATIVEQNGDEPARVYTYRGANSRDAEDFDN